MRPVESIPVIRPASGKYGDGAPYHAGRILCWQNGHSETDWFVDHGPAGGNKTVQFDSESAARAFAAKWARAIF